MGTWGSAVDADDTFQDVVGLFDHHLKREQSLDAANDAVRTSYRDQLSDFDDGPSILLAIIDRQWTSGTVDADLLARIQVDGFGLANWEGVPPDEYAKRKANIDRFIQRVSTDNPKPKKIPKLTRRKPKFSAGDCLAFELSDGRFTGGYVLATNDSDPEHGRDLIVMLDYLGVEPPAVDLFESRQWLRLNHGKWDGKLDCSWYGPEKFRSVSKKLSVVATVAVNEDDPKDVNSHKSWDGFGFQILYIEKLHSEGA